MKILFFTHLTEEFPHLVSDLPEKYPQHSFLFSNSKKEYEKEIKDCHVLVYGNPSDHEIDATDKLKLIVVPYAGVSQLNFLLLGKKGIRVANSHGNAPIVAERAVALALSCCGRVVEFHNDQINGNWHRTGDHNRPFDYWFSLIGKKVSILGMGAIGRNIASMLRGFNCSVMGFRRTRGSVSDNFEHVTSSLQEALNYGDVIFAALPITDKTKEIISGDNMHLLKGKFIINVGRGQLIEELPFFEALKSGEIRGAGIDAWYDYPSKQNRSTTGSRLPFHELNNVVFSPHAGSHAPEGKIGQLTGALDVIGSYLTEGKVKNEITGEY